MCSKGLLNEEMGHKVVGWMPWLGLPIIWKIWQVLIYLDISILSIAQKKKVMQQSIISFPDSKRSWNINMSRLWGHIMQTYHYMTSAPCSKPKRKTQQTNKGHLATKPNSNTMKEESTKQNHNNHNITEA